MNIAPKTKITQVKIFQGQKEEVEQLFNRFMKNNSSIEIIRIDTDKDNSYICRIIVFYKIFIDNK